MILPNAPGSSNDVLGRIFATKLGEVIGQQVIVENHAGAAGLIGMEMAKTAQADGYTIISTSPDGVEEMSLPASPTCCPSSPPSSCICCRTLVKKRFFF